MADSGDVDAALSQRLVGDATLSALMPDGVYFDVGAHGRTRFVVLSLIDEADTGMFGGRAFEVGLYLVKAVALSTTGADVKAAAARIDALLEQSTLTVTGYGQITIRREARVRYTEPDEERDARWQHRGGHYRVTASPVN